MIKFISNLNCDGNNTVRLSCFSRCNRCFNPKLTLSDRGVNITSWADSIVSTAKKITDFKHTDSNCSMGEHKLQDGNHIKSKWHTEYTVFQSIGPIQASQELPMLYKLEIRTNTYKNVDVFQLGRFCSSRVSYARRNVYKIYPNVLDLSVSNRVVR